MRKTSLILTAIVLACVGIITTSCGNADKDAGDKKKMVIAYQGGIGYAPVHIMKEEKLVEKNYNRDVEVEYIKLDSGAAINEGIIGGTVDVGCMGISPAISGVSKGIPYKAIANLCSQSHGLMSNDFSVKSLKDIKDTDKIAIVSPGSFQHLLLSMAAKKTLGDAHVLDNNIQRMSNAERMAALESGTVKLHLTTSPFIYQERESKKYIELPEIAEVWPRGNTHLVAMASEKLAEDKELFDATQKAFNQAVEFINKNPKETVKIESDYLKLDEATVKSYLEQPDAMFFSEIRGMKAMANFMKDEGFIDKAVNFDNFAYEGVTGN